jgi:hypothetical protein
MEWVKWGVDCLILPQSQQLSSSVPFSLRLQHISRPDPELCKVCVELLGLIFERGSDGAPRQETKWSRKNERSLEVCHACGYQACPKNGVYQYIPIYGNFHGEMIRSPAKKPRNVHSLLYEMVLMRTCHAIPFALVKLGWFIIGFNWVWLLIGDLPVGLPRECLQTLAHSTTCWKHAPLFWRIWHRWPIRPWNACDKKFPKPHADVICQLLQIGTYADHMFPSARCMVKLGE